MPMRNISTCLPADTPDNYSRVTLRNDTALGVPRIGTIRKPYRCATSHSESRISPAASVAPTKTPCTEFQK